MTSPVDRHGQNITHKWTLPKSELGGITRKEEEANLQCIYVQSLSELLPRDSPLPDLNV